MFSVSLVLAAAVAGLPTVARRAEVGLPTVALIAEVGLPTVALIAEAKQAVEKQHVLTITSQQIEGGVLSEITWDNGVLLLQGAIANPDGSLSGRYYVVPAAGTTLVQAKEQTSASMDYWTRK